MFFKKNQIHFFIIVPIIGFLFLFQNCGSEYDSKFGSMEEQSTDDTQDPQLDPPVTPPPGKAYILPTEVTPMVEPFKMNWTFTETNPDFIKAVNGLANQCETRRLDFEATVKFSPIVYDEGLLPGDPKIAAMKDVKAAFDKALDVAFCVYFAKTAMERTNALNSVTKFIVDWNATYVGDGNPINERFFVKLYTVADFIFPLMNTSQIAAARSLATRMDAKEVTFMGTLLPTDNRLKNNWKTRHLMIRVYANIILNNTAVIQQLKTAINQDINTQYTAPAGFVLSNCANLRSVGTYGSFDLQQRDAFVYHVSGLAELAPFMALNPTMVNATPNAKLLVAIEVTQPYVLGTRVHPEFVCTSVQYDRDKLALDPTLGANWNPDSSRVLYRYSRLIWKGTEPWTTRFITDQYAPWFKVFYTGKGDILTLTAP